MAETEKTATPAKPETRKVRFVIDGRKIEVEYIVPTPPKFAKLADLLAFYQNDEAKLLTAHSAGLVATVLSNAKKIAKRSWLKSNDPNRESIRKDAANIFKSYAATVWKKLDAPPKTRKEAKKLDAAKTKVLWTRAMEKARARFDESLAADVKDLT